MFNDIRLQMADTGVITRLSVARLKTAIEQEPE